MSAVIPSAETILCKGTTIKAALAYLEVRHPEAARQRVYARLGEQTRRHVTGLVLPSARYPLQTLVALCEATDAELGRGDLALCREIGRFSADFEVNMLHKAFLAVASLEYWFKLAGSMWTVYYSHGKMAPQHMDTKGGTIRLSEFNPIGKAFCERFAGWVQRVSELSRLHDVCVVHRECVLDGRPACIWEGAWRS